MDAANNWLQTNLQRILIVLLFLVLLPLALIFDERKKLYDA